MSLFELFSATTDGFRMISDSELSTDSVVDALPFSQTTLVGDHCELGNIVRSLDGLRLTGGVRRARSSKHMLVPSSSSRSPHVPSHGAGRMGGRWANSRCLAADWRRENPTFLQGLACHHLALTA